MRRIWLLFPFLSGCFLFSHTEKSKVEQTPEELRHPKLVVPPTYDTHLFGPLAGCQVGQWATYKIVEKGETATTTLALTAPDWIEVIDEGEVRHVSARHVTPDGAVDKAFYREIPSKGEPSAVYPQPISQYTGPSGPKIEPSRRDVKDEELKVGDQSMAVKAVKVDFDDVTTGRVVSERTWWSKSVPPLYAGSEEGGLVRKAKAGLTVDLTAFGTGAKPLIDIPK